MIRSKSTEVILMWNPSTACWFMATMSQLPLFPNTFRYVWRQVHFCVWLWIDRLYFPLMLARVGGMGLLDENVASYFREMVVCGCVWWGVDHKEREIGAKWLHVPIPHARLWHGSDSAREYSSSPMVCLLHYTSCVGFLKREWIQCIDASHWEAIEINTFLSTVLDFQTQDDPSSLSPLIHYLFACLLAWLIEQTPHYDPS